MHTSYFSKYKGEHGVSIARKTPKGFKGRIYSPLFPSANLLSMYKEGKLTEEEYEVIYRKETLSKLDPKKVLEDLGPNAVLLCYEKSYSFCHRYIVAKWLNETLGLIVTELDFKFCDNQRYDNLSNCNISGHACSYNEYTCATCENFLKENNIQLSLFDLL